MSDLTESEFVTMLVSRGWSEKEALLEAYNQYHGDAGDCDGDLEP